MKLRNTHLKIALAGFMVLVLSACSPAEETPEEQCLPNEVWVNETCLQTCESDANCSQGVCHESYCTDATRPSVLEVVPAQAATGVRVTSNITLSFSEAMETPVESDLTLFLEDQAVPAVVSGDEASTQFTLTPELPLSQGLNYSIRIAETFKSKAGISLGQSLSYNFTTVQPLEVASVTPTDGATDVALLPRIALSFSRGVTSESLNGISFMLAEGGPVIDVSFQASVDTSQWFLIPAAPLEPGQQYSLLIGTEVIAEDGGVLQEQFVAGFTTGDFIDGTAPSIAFDELPLLVGPNHLTQSGELILSGDAMDTETAVAWLSASLHIGEELFDLGILETLDGDHFEFTWSPTLSAQAIDALGEFSVQAVDLAGNVSENTTTVDLDFVAPEAPATLEAAAASWKFATLPLTFTTEILGSVVLRVGGGEEEVLLADEAGEITKSFQLPSEGESLTIEASAMDSVGNTSTTNWQHTVTKVPYACLHTSAQFPTPEAVHDESVFSDDGEGTVTVRYRLDPTVAQDTVLHAQLSTQNFVSTPYLSLLLFPRVLGLLKFSDTLLHPCAELVSAKLAFYSRSVCADCEVSETLGFYGVNTSWNSSQVTWAQASNANQWSEPGLSLEDRDELTTAQMIYEVEQDTDVGGVDLTVLVQAWVEYLQDSQTGRPNEGVAFFQEDSLRADFHSVDASNPEEVPYLELVWMEQP